MTRARGVALAAALTLVCLSAAPVRAQSAAPDPSAGASQAPVESAPATRMVSVAPLAIPPGAALRYDLRVGGAVSVMAMVGAGAIAIDDVRYWRAITSFGASWYPLGGALAGPFVAPRLTFDVGAIDASSEGIESARASRFGGGLLAGWRYVSRPGWSVGAAAGAQYFGVLSLSDTEDAEGNRVSYDRSSVRGVFPAIELTLGWAF